MTEDTPKKSKIGKKAPKVDKNQAKIDELLSDLQRLRADFENYRKRVDSDKQIARYDGETSAVMRLLPILDTIDRATSQVPAEIADNSWVRGVVGIAKQLDKLLAELKLAKIEASTGTPFDPELHQAVQFDEASEGEQEVIAEELQPGYTLSGRPIRHSMVRVTRK